jgi:hypothetical protein
MNNNQKRRKYVRRNPDIVNEIIDRISSGETFKSISCDEHMPSLEVFSNWAKKDIDLQKRYADAKNAWKANFPLDELFTRIAAGEPMRQICKDAHMPGRSFFNAWMARDPELRARYISAKELLMEQLSEEILQIADDISHDTDPASAAINLHRAKLQIDTRKWLMSRLAPKRYGDRLNLDTLAATAEPRKIEIEIINPKNS